MVAAGALMLSLVIATINAYYAMRGPEVVLQPPDQILLYRDGEGEYAVLTVAAPILIINASSAEHGDVMVEATLKAGEHGGRYRYATLVQPIFTEDARAAREKCEVGVRCIVFDDLVVVERTDEIVDVPGGSAKSRYLAFHLVPPNCQGSKAECARFPDYRRSLAAIDNRPFEVEIKVDFHSDGSRTVVCRAPKADLSYLKEVGWTALPCVVADVRGDRLL